MEREKILKLIKEGNKITLVKAFIQSTKEIEFTSLKQFGNKSLYLVIGDYVSIKNIIEENKEFIINYHIDIIKRNSSIDLLDYSSINARIEPGAIIREYVNIEEGAIILMGAIINIGASIGKNTMIDMNAVIGSNAIIKDNVHIGAGAVISGVLEPLSNNPVVIEDNVFIGANAVILEGVKVSSGSIVGAGAVVTKDVPSDSVVVGIPARIVKKVNRETSVKTKNNEDLR